MKASNVRKGLKIKKKRGGTKFERKFAKKEKL